MRRTPTPALLLAAILTLGTALSGCGLGSEARTTRGAGPGATGSSSQVTPGAPEATPTKADLAYDRLTPQQRVGQLFMFGMTTTGPSEEMYAALVEHQSGNVFLRGQSDEGAAAVRAVTDEIAAATTYAGVRPFVSADQEGGNAQALEGEGFSEMPTALTQGTQERRDLKLDAREWASELRGAGVNVDLAPVGDVVPAEVGAANAPIGFFRRQYGSTPEVVKPAVSAFITGMQKESVATSVKHFPGIGRATGNTDSDATAVDPTVPGDPYLAPFRRAVQAGAAFVMVSSATYPELDADNRACFSPLVLQEMLRGDLGFEGVIISDSFGSAAVAGTPPGERAVRYFRAGGTMLLDTNYLDAAPMSQAVLAEMERDPAFAAIVESDVRLVLAAKERFGLLD
ncbi:MAG: glycoside hydrolase family 3 [Nocardioides sp.]|nr:glycoside hydrolase family 3 [Nocardioides sp.]